jgi:hypothetical protein
LQKKVSPYGELSLSPFTLKKLSIDYWEAGVSQPLGADIRVVRKMLEWQ